MSISFNHPVKIRLRFFCLLLLLLPYFNSSNAQTFHYRTTEASEMLKGDDLYTHGFPDTVITWCNDWDFITDNLTSWRDSIKLKSNNSFVKFSVDNYDRLTKYGTYTGYTYHLMFHIIGYTNPADTIHTFITNSDTLLISFNNGSDNTPYQDLNLKKYSNFYKLIVIVDGIMADSAGTVVPANAMLADQTVRNFNVEASILTQHYDKKQYGTGGSATAPVITAASHAADNYLGLNWNFSSGTVTPVSYELEWTYTDDYDVDASSGSVTHTSPSSLNYDFAHNSTRVWLDTNNYRVPLTYANGYIVYRVRAVRPDSNQFKYPIYGPWSLADAGVISSGYYHVDTAYTGDSLNWQYTVSFAEGGKYKHVASFYDGLLKSRQSITRYNSYLSKLIVTNNVYDYEGRLCLKTLPAPTGATYFGYLHNVDLNAVTNIPYRALDFDTGFSACPNNIPVSPLATNALASIYYSGHNPDTVTNSYQKYVPDAQGYPFVQTIYEPGYNDRIAAQGGAGPRLQIGDTNFVSNIYVDPMQPVLNSLFGYNIGWSKYYTMTVSSDPNQQLSMMIRDYEGKPMASALIGPGHDTSAHYALSPYSVPSPEYSKLELLTPNNQTIDVLAGTRTADVDYFNEAQATDSLQYQYTFIPFQPCIGQYLTVKGHYDCIVTDQCGNITLRQDTVLGANGVSNSSTTVSYGSNVDNYTADKAPYHVHKTLSFASNDIAATVDSFFSTAASSSCFLTEPWFIKQSVDNAIFPCPPSATPDSDDCSKLKWEMMQQLLPGAVYGKYSTATGFVVGTNNSVFSLNCPPDTLVITKHLPSSAHTCYVDSATACQSYGGVYQGSVYGGDAPDGIFKIIINDTCFTTPPSTFTTNATFLLYSSDPGAAILFADGSVETGNMTGYMVYRTNSDSSINDEHVNITSGGAVIGSINSTRALFAYDTITLPVTISGDSIYTNISGVISPGTDTIHIIFNGHLEVSYLTYSDSFTVDSIVSGYDAGNCNYSSSLHYRYQDSCNVALPDTITVNGVLYHGLTTMAADSFIMIYNEAIAAGNYSIAEDLLPLHPQYCELKNCFNDTFKTQLLAIPNWQVAQSLDLFYLDSLAAHDPIKSLISGNGYDSLLTFQGGLMRLDTLIFMNAYCSCNDSVMFRQCVTDMFADEIGHHLLVNAAAKTYYFNNIISTYLSNRERFVTEAFMKGGDSCSHCSLARMTFDPAAALPPAPYPDTSNVAIAGSGSTGWITNMSTDSVTALYDSTQALYHYTDSSLVYGEIDTIMAHLSNCIAGSSTMYTKIRDSLISCYKSGAVSAGNFSAQQIYRVLTGNGVSINDLCNPFILDCSDDGAPAPANSCLAPSYYTSIGGFMNDAHITGALHATGTAFTGMVLDSAANIFEKNVALALGSTSVDVTASYSSVLKTYTIDLTVAGNTDTVSVYLHSPDCGNIFSGLSSGTYSVSADCINSSAALVTGQGQINQYAFIATVTPASGSPCTMTGWVDSIQTMAPAADNNNVAQCIPCTQMRTLYTQFNDSLLAYGLKGTDHPYYDVMLANFMNLKLQQQYTSGDYETFIQSCALADSMLIPLYAGYATYTFSGTAGMDSFIAMLDRIDPNYSFDNSYRDSIFVSGSPVITVTVDLNAIPRPELWQYKNALTAYSGTYSSRIVDSAFSALKPAGEIGFLYTSSATFMPQDSLIIDTTTVKFPARYQKAVWMAGRFVMQYFYDVIANPGTPPYTVSKDVYQLTAYIYNHNIPGTVFIPLYMSTIDADYFKPRKQAYLKYTYGFQQLPEYQVLDSIQGQYLQARIPSYSVYKANYSQTGSNPGVFTSLYLGNAAMNNRFYDTLQHIINLSGSSGAIFYNADVTPITAVAAPRELTAYICSDDSYWYRYFDNADTLYNVYVAFPAYIPKYLRSQYHVVGAVIPTPGDSFNRCFALNVVRGSSADTIQVQGRASFVIGKSIELDHVLMGRAPGGVNVAGTDTFDNCERQTLYSAVDNGIANYNSYMDSMKSQTLSDFKSYVANAVSEKLILGYMNAEYQYTLYNYDRAGNLAFTVPPAGVTPIPNTGTLLGDIDSARIHNNPGLATPLSYNKINTYTYNSLNEVQQQTTINGGTTRFMYDAVGRLIFSQNAKQAVDGYYTYNIYDAQSRLTETGEAQMGCAYFEPYVNTHLHGYPSCFYIYYPTPVLGGPPQMVSPDPYYVFFVDRIRPDSVVSFIRSLNRRDVVMTFYDTVAKRLDTIRGLNDQENLRKRVSCVKYFGSLAPSDSTYTRYSYATHYSYDIDGNVSTLVQDMPELANIKQEFKRVDYDYDLISGKVNMLSYNRGWPDQYYQQYSYDADNRITSVQTSADGLIWKTDASYSYYQHGPLARLQLGDLKVQGIDYAYTIQGWLKAANGDTLNANRDMGNDGLAGNITAKDAVAYTVDYFTNDYKSITGRQVQNVTPTTLSLFNGNIARQTVAIDTFQKLNKQYIYDQLNRIHSASYAAVDPALNTLTGLTDFHNSYSYDADGNILSLLRYGNRTATGVKVMDSLIYGYGTLGNDDKLQVLKDYAPNNYTNDIAQNTSTAARYTYDATGNVIRDLVSGQDTVTWNLYNKVTGTLNRTGHNTMSFAYDGAGNRVAKYYTETTDSSNLQRNDYYVRDAQGNILAIYKERNVYKSEPVSIFIHLNNYMRSAIGGSTNFNNQFVTPMFGGSGDFRDALVSSSLGDDAFVSAQLAHPVSWYLNVNPRMYYDMLSAGGYFAALGAGEIAGTDSIETTTMMNCLDYVTAGLLGESGGDGHHHHHHHLYGHHGVQPELTVTDGNIMMSLHGPTDEQQTMWDIKRYLGSDDTKQTAAEGISGVIAELFADSTARAHYMGMLCGVEGGDSLLRDVVLMLAYSVAAKDSVTGVVDSAGLEHIIDSTIVDIGCDSAVRYVMGYGIDPSVLSQALLVTGDINYRPTLWHYMHRLLTDSFSLTNMTAIDKAVAAFPLAIGVFGDRGQVVRFFDSDTIGRYVLNQITNPEKLLRVVYGVAPATFINAYDAALGDAALDSVMITAGALVHMSYTTYLSALSRFTGVTISPRTLLTSSVLQSEDFALAEHDIYGSSRLGIKSYYGTQAGINFVIDPVSDTGAWTDTARLWSHLPWYSGEYQDLVKLDSLSPFGNSHTDMYFAQHVLGQKQYELTDHLGDVLATVSDKRAADSLKGTHTAGSLDSIKTWKPVVVTAHDYYPFGEYMPGRYRSDTDTHCLTTTVTERIHQIYYIFESWVNTGGGGGPVLGTFGGATTYSATLTPQGTGPVMSAMMVAGDSASGVTYHNPAPVLVSDAGTPLNVSVGVAKAWGMFDITVTDDSTGHLMGKTTVNHTQGQPQVYVVPIKNTGTPFSVNVTNVTTHRVPLDSLYVPRVDTTYVWVHGDSGRVPDTLTHWPPADSSGTGDSSYVVHPYRHYGGWVIDTFYRWPPVVIDSSGGGPYLGGHGVIFVTGVWVPHDTIVNVDVLTEVCSDDGYRYGYNGQMKVNEIAGLGNHNTSLYGEFDPRTGRRWNKDPVHNNSLSSYATFNNSPISNVDGLGNVGEVIYGPNGHITIKLALYFYGGAASVDFMHKAVENINRIWNNTHGTIGGHPVTFVVTSDYIAHSYGYIADLASSNKDDAYSPQMNFVRMEHMGKNFSSSTATWDGDNSFFFNVDLIDDCSTTEAHEIGHGFGLKHDPNYSLVSGTPDLMATIWNMVEAGFTINGKAGANNPAINSDGKHLPPLNPINKDLRQVSQTNLNAIKITPTNPYGRFKAGNSSNNLYNANGDRMNNSNRTQEAKDPIGDDSPPATQGGGDGNPGSGYCPGAESE